MGKFIKTTLDEYLFEDIDNNNIKNILIKRIPFLKEYNIFADRDKNRLEAQRLVSNENVKIVMQNDILIFPQYNICSEITYYPHKINDNIFYNFIIKNTFHVMKPEGMDDLLFRVFILAKKQLEEKMSYKKEVMLKSDVDFPLSVLDEIVNDMNGNLFRLEEFAEKNSISFF